MSDLATAVARAAANGPALRVAIIGTGLIGGSVGIGLRRHGWHVTAIDRDPDVAARAAEIGAADDVATLDGLDPATDLTVIATPVGDVAALAQHALGRTDGAVTDVGSTKLDVCVAIDHPRFVGGHPMAGSEQDGLAGADGDLFSGATWVLTPGDVGEGVHFTRVRRMVRVLGAEPVTLGPREHDQMVALVSHVPHLTAASLMVLADDATDEHRALLRLAAGGFRDMTRISAGRPGIWPDICVSNKTAIVAGLDRLIEALGQMRTRVADQDRDGLLEVLDRARAARTNLPTGYAVSDDLVEMSIPIPDRPGEIAAIATLATELDVNLLDLELTHSGEGRRGVLITVIDAGMQERFYGALVARGYRPRTRPLD